MGDSLDVVVPIGAEVVKIVRNLNAPLHRPDQASWLRIAAGKGRDGCYGLAVARQDNLLTGLGTGDEFGKFGLGFCD